MTYCKLSSQIYLDNLFQNNLSGCWDQIHILPCKVTVYSYMRCFQYKIINNILFLNKNYIFLESVKLPCAQFVIQKKKQHFIFSLSAVKHSLYARSSENTSMMTFLCLFYHHRLSFMNFQTFENLRICSYLIIFFLFLSSIFVKLGKKKLCILKCY